MSNLNSLGSERVAVLDAIDPADQATAAVSTAYVDAGDFNRLMAVVQSGALTGTLDAKLEQATDSSGTGNKDVTDKAITQLASTDDNVQAIINCRADELDVANGFRYVRLTLTPTGGTTNLAAGILAGVDPRYAPASDNDAASVTEVVE